MAYNSAHKGSEIDSAISAVKQKETIWDSKQDGLTGQKGQFVGFIETNIPGAMDAPGLPLEVEVLETICDNVVLTDGFTSYNFPSPISLDSDALYYLAYDNYDRNDTVAYSIRAFSKVDDLGKVSWGDSEALIADKTYMTESGIYGLSDNMKSTSYVTVLKVDIKSLNDLLLLAMRTEGSNTLASGLYSHAEGSNTTASGAYSHAEGSNTTASGAYSHAEGSNTTASGAYSNAEGFNTLASGLYSHAEGSNTTASGQCSHAEGYYADASGQCSHAEGYQTDATGSASHAEGSMTTASGRYSHSGGYHTVASSYCQTAIGVHNVEYKNTSAYTLNDDAIFIIGKGTTSAKANAFRVGTSKVWGGTYASSGADYAEYFEWLDGNPNHEDRTGLFVTLDGEKIRLAQPEDDYVLGIVSGNPSIAGDVHDDQWSKMYVSDIFGRPVYETVEVPEEFGPDGEILVEAHTATQRKLNPEYDSAQKYLARSDRPEWDAVGMMGKLVALDDGSCEVNGYCSVGVGGVATKSNEKTSYRVMARLDDTHVRLLVR